jgi:hypothetical protein
MGKVGDSSHVELEQAAITLARTGELTDAFGKDTGPTAHPPPLYTAFLAGLHRVFGIDSPAAVAAQRLCSTFACCLGIALLPLVARRSRLGNSAGVIAALVLSVYPFHIFVETFGRQETVYGILLCQFLYLTWLRLREQRWQSLRHVLLLAFLTGLTALTCPSTLAFVALALLFDFLTLAGQRVRVSMAAGVVVVVSGVMLAPWIWRNHVVLGGFIPLRSNLGLELFIGNNPESDGHTFTIPYTRPRDLDAWPHPSQSPRQRQRLRELGEYAYMEEMKAQAVAWIRAHPDRFARLTLDRLAMYWFPPVRNWHPEDGARFLRSLSAWTISCACLAGIALLFWQLHRNRWPLLLVLIAPSLVYLVTHVNVRYRYSTVWTMALLGGYALSRLRLRGKVRQSRERQEPSWKLLTLLRSRVTIVVGDNVPLLARGLELTPEEFRRARERLLALGLAEEEPLGDGYSRLAITDEGVLQATGRCQPPGGEEPGRLQAPLAAVMRRWRSLRGGWLRDYLRPRSSHWRQLPANQTVDVMVLVTDHFEPSRGPGHGAAVESVRTWCERYEQLAGRHRDVDGRPPQHTWFYRYDYPNADCLRLLSESVFRGFGEVEFHLHHGHDTEGSFAATLRAGLEWFNGQGAMLSAEATPRQRFGYIAGNWSLDNGSGNDAFSGCDTEIRALLEAGCYADFTFPALGSRAQPRLANRIWYAREDGRAKSYNDGIEASVGQVPPDDLMIFSGAIAMDWWRGRFDDAAIEKVDSFDPRRLPLWLSSGVCVAGRPEWVFVKLHTHAMQNRAAFLGPRFDALFTAMEQKWNRGRFRLHYVTAREAFNMVRAAADGQAGNAGDFRDYCIPPPANRMISCNVPWRLLCWTPREVRLEIHCPGPAHVQFAGLPVHSVSGHLQHIHAIFKKGELESLRVLGKGAIEVAPSRYHSHLQSSILQAG